MFKKRANPFGSDRPKPKSKPLWGDDDDDGLDEPEPPMKRRMFNPKDDSADQSKTQVSAGPAAEEEDDELEAFMAGINAEIKEQETAPAPPKPAAARDDLEEEDFMESYVKHMKKRGVEIGKNGPADMSRSKDVDSDEEVYATARAVDAALGDDGEDREASLAGLHNTKEIVPLAPVDHSTIEYPEIEKDFYEEHADIAALSEAEVDRIRKELDMRVSGHDVVRPCISFAHFGFDNALIETIRRYGYTEPTGIQRQAVPVALRGRDIIGIAKTGSGKTAAFIWPMLVHMMDQEELQKGEGPIGLVLAPTRELAHQIYLEAKKFAKAYGVRVGVVYGGASKHEQFKELRAGVDMLVATPGRLIDLIKMKATNLRRVSFLVLDEADRMFDLGFEPQVRSVCNNIRPDRQTLLFSATFQKRVERLARDVLNDQVRITIGSVGQANTDITQVIEVVEDDGYKWNWLISKLAGFAVNGSVLVFVGRKVGVDALAGNLKESGFDCGPLHGDMLQHERDAIIRDFKAGKVKILISTDVAARGLDIKSIKTVVNYDVAKDIDSHVHRIGRTGRAGEKGTAYTLITQKEDRFAGELVRNLEQSGQPVPPHLLALAMKNGRFRKSRERNGAGGRGRGGRGRGRGGARGGLGLGMGRGGPGNANNIPLGARSSAFGSGGGTGINMRFTAFQKATSTQAGAPPPPNGRRPWDDK